MFRFVHDRLAILLTLMGAVLSYKNLHAAASSSSDIRLRVLIEQIKPNEKFYATSPNMFIGSNDLETSDHVSCEFRSLRSYVTPLKRHKKDSSFWFCNSANQSVKIERNLHIHSQTGVISIGEQSYRGHIELLATKDSLYVINHVPLDAYLASLANTEMSSSFPEAALQAQIIAARSYALSTALERRKKMWPFDLYNSQVDQVYKGLSYESTKSWKLARSTARQVLSFNGSVLKAYYHSSSGGQLELPLNVWGGEKAQETGAYKAKPNPYDQKNSADRWQIKLSPDMGAQIKGSGTIHDIKILSRTEGKRVKTLQILGAKGKTLMSGVQFRNLFGPGWIKSALFDIKKQGNAFLIEGRGWGHGVGMSQMGAKVMADTGKSAEQILKFYYPGAHVSIYGRKRAPENFQSSGIPASVSAR